MKIDVNIKINQPDSSKKEKIKEISQGFESILIKTFIKNSGILKNNLPSIYCDIAEDFLSKEIAKKGIGLNEYFFRLISEKLQKD